MNPTEEYILVRQAVQKTCCDAGLDWPPKSNGPVSLRIIIEAYPLVHEEVPVLNQAVVSAILGRWGIRWTDFANPDVSLAGFLYANARHGFIFVRRGDVLPRRRFTVAHELGHFLLHLTPELAQQKLAETELGHSDVTIAEANEELEQRERQANQFAAELLMPESVCRELVARQVRKKCHSPRFLIHQLAIGQYARGSKERPIESVIIDEGFGSLDRQGRDEMIDQLRVLRGRLARIVLVSHQEEFAAAFPDGYRFEVVDGSTVVRPFHR